MWRSHDHPARRSVLSASGGSDTVGQRWGTARVPGEAEGASASHHPALSASTSFWGSRARSESCGDAEKRIFRNGGRDLPPWRHSYAWTGISRRTSTGTSRSASGGKFRPTPIALAHKVRVDASTGHGSSRVSTKRRRMSRAQGKSCRKAPQQMNRRLAAVLLICSLWACIA